MPYKSYFRSEIDAMSGYTPGEQPKEFNLIKLNTNENPYPPSPRATAALHGADLERLRLYPDPNCDKARDAAAALHGVTRENIIAGNGSDDLLTMAIRCFTAADKPAVCFDPTYSLYIVLAQMQGAECRKIPLREDFSLPDDVLEQARGANLFLIARPNSPTGRTYPLAQIEMICAGFDGIVFIDEAYADFAADNCAGLVKKFDNVIISRTMSKSYAMAGARFGYAVAHTEIINGMMKVKDSYNVNMLTQTAAAEALADREYLAGSTAKILCTRARLCAELDKLNFTTIPSDANFIFTTPPDGDGKRFFEILRQHHIITRYFPGAATGKYLRISIGTDQQINQLLDIARQLYR
jgi:histidinol-phosphate aminotransferase